MLSKTCADGSTPRLRGRTSRRAEPVFLGTADPRRPGTPAAIVTLLRELLAREYGLELSRDVHVSATGSTAGPRALAAACARLAHERGVSACVVVAGDSLVNASTLNWLDEQARLKRPDNSDGVIPGEAAACVVVARRPPPAVARPVRLVGLGLGTEAATPSSDEPLRGVGIVEAVRAALREAGLSLADIDVRLSDAAGEGYAFKELALLLGRLLRERHEPIPLRLPAESLGDTGAAAGLVALVLGVAELSAPRSSLRRALVLASDVDGDRSAVVLSTSGP